MTRGTAVVILKSSCLREERGVCGAPPLASPPTQLQVGGTLLQEHHAERPGVSDTARLCGYVSPLPLHSLHTTLTLSSHDTRNAPRGPIGGIVISAGLMGGEST